MQNLIEKCWIEEASDRPSFDEIFETLSNDFSYSDEIDNTMNDERSELKSRTGSLSYIFPWSWWTKKKSVTVMRFFMQQMTASFFWLLIQEGYCKWNVAICDVDTIQSRNEGNRYASHLGLLHVKEELVTGDSKKSLHCFEMIL